MSKLTAAERLLKNEEQLKKLSEQRKQLLNAIKEENEQTFSELVKAREKLLLIVPKSRLDDFKNSEFYENMTLQNIYGTFSIYVPRKDTI